MAFVDEITIRARAGRGGDGVVRWRHEKGKEFAGPSGGDGGKGGDVYVEGVRDIGLLSKYRHTKVFEAEDGGSGRSGSMHGESGKDLIIALPVGSVVSGGEKRFEVVRQGERVLLLKGGNGGLGNERFKSSTNRTPKERTFGKPGEEGDFHIALELMVDAGLIGLPNAGKSSLLNALTRAGAKVAAYPFTTLEPNLGEFYGYVIADIPGLIEEAASGRGLGHKFLRHIKRTKLLLHCVSLEEGDPLVAYRTVRKELEAYGQGLPEKPEVIVLTKSDAVSKERAAVVQKEFAKEGKEVLVVSVIDDALVEAFAAALSNLLRR